MAIAGQKKSRVGEGEGEGERGREGERERGGGSSGVSPDIMCQIRWLV